MSIDIEIRSGSVFFDGGDASTYALRDANATFPAHSVTGLIGESGSGKSVLGMSILGLLPNTARIEGSCVYKDRDLYRLSEREMTRIRGSEIALIPQNPSESLNPMLRIGRQLSEAVALRGRGEKPRALERRDSLLERFGFADPRAIDRSYSFQLSGGMNQRVVSALGLMGSPRWVIADEPTKGLDAILRKQVYGVLKEIAENEVEGMIVITHDIALACALCDTIMVLYKGLILEQRSSAELMGSPLHPYTRGLIGSLPSRGMHPICRDLPGRDSHVEGCPFYPRCAVAEKRCSESIPPETPLSPNGFVRCFLNA